MFTVVLGARVALGVCAGALGGACGREPMVLGRRWLGCR